MFEQIRRLFILGKLNDTGVRNAIKKGWLTQEQAEFIINENKTVETENTTDIPEKSE